MSWASRRRAAYSIGIIVLFVVAISVPIFKHFSKPPTCADGTKNQGETAPDKGGPCQILDERALAPSSVLWSRSFNVRNGSYSSVAYVENSNNNAGVRNAKYRFGLYDNGNLLIVERTGTAFIMPSGITPIFESGIDTGNREVYHTYLEFTEPLVWERLNDPASEITINNKILTGANGTPRLEATVLNGSVAAISDISFVAVIFSTSGNAFASSKTTLLRLYPGEKQQIVFTWPDAFDLRVGRIDIFPLVLPDIKK